MLLILKWLRAERTVGIALGKRKGDSVNYRNAYYGKKYLV